MRSVLFVNGVFWKYLDISGSSYAHREIAHSPMNPERRPEPYSVKISSASCMYHASFECTGSMKCGLWVWECNDPEVYIHSPERLLWYPLTAQKALLDGKLNG